MLSENLHISDTELLLMADGELPDPRTAQVRAHLAACWGCRARSAQIEATILDFTRAYRETPVPELPPLAGSRALLSAHLSELASKSHPRSWGWLRSFSPIVGTGAVCIGLLTVVLAGRLVLLKAAGGGTQVHQPSLEQGVVPDGRLTPGATRNVAIEDLCSSAHEEVVGQVTASLRDEVLKEYGMQNARASDYEIDYLIAPGLGGTEDIQNLWPQPYAARIWNAYAKDTLEEHLHQLVCRRELDLAVAQQAIARDWITAYKKYLATNRPLSSNAEPDTERRSLALRLSQPAVGISSQTVNRFGLASSIELERLGRDAESLESVHYN